MPCNLYDAKAVGCADARNTGDNCRCYGVKLKNGKMVCLHCEKENPFHIRTCSVGGCPQGADL